MRAENEAGRSLWSPLGEGRTAAVAPGPCGGPTVLGSSHTSLSIRWQVSMQGLDTCGLRLGCAAPLLSPRPASLLDGAHGGRAPQQGPEDDGGSPVCSYLVELRPRSQAARRTTGNDWVLAYQVAGWLG